MIWWLSPLFDRQKVSTWIATEDIKTVLAKDWGYRISPVVPVLQAHFFWWGGPSKLLFQKDMVKMAKISYIKQVSK